MVPISLSERCPVRVANHELGTEGGESLEATYGESWDGVQGVMASRMGDTIYKVVI